MTGEAFHMHLVNNGARGRVMKWSIAFPIVGVGIHHDTFHRRRGVSALPTRRLAIVPLGNNDAAAVRVKQDLGGVEPHSACGIKWAVNAVPVELPWFHIRYEHMPVVVG